MPYSPTVKKKPWHQTKKEMHERVKDMRWFYNDRRWRKFSKRFKAKNTLCASCKEKGFYVPTKVTDHIKTYEEEPKGFDLDNLQDKYMQPLCTSCHNKKSGREAHKS